MTPFPACHFQYQIRSRTFAAYQTRRGHASQQRGIEGRARRVYLNRRLSPLNFSMLDAYRNICIDLGLYTGKLYLISR
jgi:hypothetical protein